MNSMKVTIQSNLENVKVSRGIISSFLSNENITLNILNEIKTIVSEAVTNAIVHGYKSNNDQYVYIECSLDNNILKMSIKDEGVGIQDIIKAREPLYTTLESEDRAGLGFTIMDIFSDKLEVYSKINEGTIIMVEKRIK